MNVSANARCGGKPDSVLDRVGNIPFSGADITLDLSTLSAGGHTLLVYVVDGEQNYGMASYAIVV